MLHPQRFLRRPVPYPAPARTMTYEFQPFLLTSYDDPTLCVDIQQGSGPVLEMYRCKGAVPSALPNMDYAAGAESLEDSSNGDPSSPTFAPTAWVGGSAAASPVPSFMSGRSLLNESDWGQCTSSYPMWFTENLTGIECMGMSCPSHVLANTSDQCAAACCNSPQGFEHCEAWQWCEDCMPKNERCWIGKCPSFRMSVENWIGRARPTPNQIFYLNCTAAEELAGGGCVLASVQDWTTPASSSSAHPTCLNVLTTPPGGFVRPVPNDTPILPRPW
jgi:hypothetical protein